MVVPTYGELWRGSESPVQIVALYAMAFGIGSSGFLGGDNSMKFWKIVVNYLPKIRLRLISGRSEEYEYRGIVGNGRLTIS